MDNLSHKDLVQIVKKYGGNCDDELGITVCPSCNKIRPLKYDRHMSDVEYTIGEKTYETYCCNCNKIYPLCCLKHIMYSQDHYKRHPSHLTRHGGPKCKRCIIKDKSLIFLFWVSFLIQEMKVNLSNQVTMSPSSTFGDISYRTHP